MGVATFAPTDEAGIGFKREQYPIATMADPLAADMLNGDDVKLLGDDAHELYVF